MSVNKVNKTTGELITLANGTRMWIGTQSAHDAAVAAGTMPNNCMVCITDDAAGDDAWKYSTEETNTGKTWIDGKPIYRKVIDVGILPDTATKEVAHGISNLERVVQLYGTFINSPNKWAPIPWVSTGGTGNNISCEVNSTYVRVVTGVNRSVDYSCYVVIEYTKTTD